MAYFGAYFLEIWGVGVVRIIFNIISYHDMIHMLCEPGSYILDIAYELRVSPDK